VERSKELILGRGIVAVQIMTKSALIVEPATSRRELGFGTSVLLLALITYY
jgi:hypothetical protein